MPDKIEGFIKGIVFGGVIGAAAGVFRAPKSGRETREDIDRAAERLLKRAQEEYEAALQKIAKANKSTVNQLGKHYVRNPK